MTSLFGSSGSQPRSKHLLEFKAGKMTLQGKLVKPDKRKGCIYIYQGDDSIMHFCWKDRTNGAVEEDLMIFPDDIEYKKIPQCTTGRAYLLKFKSSNKKLFFWMQEPDAEKDDQKWKKLNELLNNPPSGSSGSDRSNSNAVVGLANALGGDLSGLGSSADLQSIFGSMNEQQIQQLLGGINGLIPVNSPTSNRSGSSNLSSTQTSRVQSSTVPGSRAAATASATAATPNEPAAAATTADASKPKSDEKKVIQFNDLQSILGNLSTSVGEDQKKSVDLSDVITFDVMAPILTNKEVQETLIKYLPEGDVLPKNEIELKNIFGTPQFKRAMSSFCEAIQSGQLGPLMHQFNLPAEVSSAAVEGNLEKFAKAMETHLKTGNKKVEEESNQMDTDNKN